MSENALAIPNVEDLKQKVAETMQAAMGRLIPEQAWDKIIDAEWVKFTQDKVIEGHPRRIEPSTLSKMVQAELATHFKARVEEWGRAWAQRHAADPFIAETFKEATKIAAESFLGSVAESITSVAMHCVAQGLMPCKQCARLTPKGASCSHCGHWNNSTY